MMEGGYLGNPKLKRVGVKDSFTEEQALEIAKFGIDSGERS